VIRRAARALALTVLVSPALAAAATFLQVPNAPGKATDRQHAGWIPVESVDWTTTAATNWTSGAGASIGKPNPGPITLTMRTGPWSPAFLRAIATGTALDAGKPVVLEHVDPEGRPVYRMTFVGFYVTKYQPTADGEHGAVDRVSAVFSAITLETFYLLPDGRPATNALRWNIPAGTVQ
jgi:type VI protein secretion system component Hcp